MIEGRGERRSGAAAAVLAKPFFLLMLVLALKFLLLRSLVFLSADVPRFLVTDLTTAVLVAALVEAAPRWRRWVLIAADVFVSALLAVALTFHAYYGRLPSLQALSFAEQLRGVESSVTALLDPALLLLFADVLPLVALALLRPAFFERRAGARVAVSLAALALAVAAVDVGLGVLRPIPDFTLAAEARGIVNQEIADWVLRDFVAGPDAGVKDPARLQARLDELRRGDAPAPSAEVTSALAGIAKGRNVILVVAESLQDFAVGATVGGRPVTPSIDALAREGYRFDNVFAQTGAGNTSDAEFVVNTSLMPFERVPFAVDYGDRALPSLPKLLAARGYRTMTFHPNVVTFWYRDRLYPALGFDEVYDAEFYGRHDRIGIGESDDAIFTKALPVLERAAKDGTPFYATIVTITSHIPYDLPADRRTLPLPEQMGDTLTGDYLVAQNYTDAALGRFVEGLKKAGLYEDSVIVVVGDHAGLPPSIDGDDLRVASEVAGHPYGAPDRGRVPFVVAVPGAGRSEVVHTPGGQVDVLPTLAAALGLSLDGFVHAGRDLTAPGPSLVGLRYHEPVGTYVDDEVIAIPRGSRPMEAWDLATGRRLPAAPADAADKVRRVTEIEQLSDAYLRAMPRR